MVSRTFGILYEQKNKIYSIKYVNLIDKTHMLWYGAIGIKGIAPF